MAESEEEKARSILEEQERLHREQMEQLRSKLQEEAELREKAKRGINLFEPMTYLEEWNV